MLVTGGANGIGTAFADRCRTDGHRVISIDLEPAANANLSLTADLTDPVATGEALAAALAEGPVTGWSTTWARSGPRAWPSRPRTTSTRCSR